MLEHLIDFLHTHTGGRAANMNLAYGQREHKIISAAPLSLGALASESNDANKERKQNTKHQFLTARQTVN